MFKKYCIQTKIGLILPKQYLPVWGPVCLLVENYALREYLRKVNGEKYFVG